MKIRLEFSPSAEVLAEKAPGGEIHSLVIKPIFSSPRGSIVLAYGEAKNEKGITLDQFQLVVSGATGQLYRRGISVCPPDVDSENFQIPEHSKRGPVKAAASNKPDEESDDA